VCISFLLRYNWSIVLPAELSAAAVLIGYWIGPYEVNPAVWITVCMVIVVLINVLGAGKLTISFRSFHQLKRHEGAYGEAEFIFAYELQSSCIREFTTKVRHRSIKIITIVGLIILGLIIDLGGALYAFWCSTKLSVLILGAPSRDRLGFRYWKDPGAFAQYQGIEGATGRFLGFFSVLTQASFSYIGTEIVAVTAAEAQNPRYSIPRAIKRVYIRPFDLARILRKVLTDIQ
jgi:yeast amino acid transporter